MPEDNITPTLEAILVKNDSTAKEHTQLLEHILEKSGTNNTESLLEAQLVLSGKNTKELVNAIKNIPDTKEVIVKNTFDTTALEDKLIAIEKAITEKEYKEIDLSQVVLSLNEIRDKEINEVEYPDLTIKLDELISIVKESSKEDDIDYTSKFDELIKEIKKSNKSGGMSVMGSGSVEIQSRGVVIHPATEETLQSVAKLNIPKHDTVVIDESLSPATTVITYKLLGTTVATKTITVSGTTTTVTIL